MGTNYYVNTPSCPNACEHCAESERVHLGKSSVGWRFLFYAEPDWPRDEAFAYWVRRALSGPVVDEYGRAASPNSSTWPTARRTAKPKRPA